MPEGENIRRAIKWISANLEEDRKASGQAAGRKSCFQI